MGDEPVESGSRDILSSVRQSNDLSFFNNSKIFDLRNYDRFIDMIEDFPQVSNTYTNLNTLQKFDNKQYMILSVNIFSLSSKYNELSAYLDSLSQKNIVVAALMVQETWGSSNIFAFHNYKFEFVNRTKRLGGGVAIYANCSFKPKFTKKIMIEGDFECISAVLKCPSGETLNLVNIYHPPSCLVHTPNTHFDIFNNKLSDLIGTFNSNSKTIIAGDFNTCLLKSQFADNFLCTLYEGGFHIVNYLASRITSSNQFSFIDQIAVNSGGIISGVHSAVDSPSDHDIIMININKKFVEKSQADHPKKPKKAYFRLINDANLEKFRKKLLEQDWNGVKNNMNLQSAYNSFYETFFNHFNNSFPLKKTRTSIKSVPLNPWFCSRLRNYRTRLDDLKLAKKRDPNKLNKYKSYRNCYKRMCAFEKKKYFRDKIEQTNGQPREVWRVLNSAYNPHKNNDNKIEALKDPTTGEIYKDDEKIADCFRRYYDSFTDVISENIIFDPNSTLQDFLPPPTNTRYNPRPVSQDEIIKLLDSTKPKSSTDINGLNSNVLKYVKNEISYILSDLYSRSISQGMFPDQAKISKIIPLHKKNCELELGNYRGISLIESFGKILEKLVYNRLYSYLEKNKLIYDLQYGFRKRLGVDICLVNLLNRLSEAFNNQEIGSVLSLDCMKAFDMVSWPVLFEKLNNLGVRGNNLRFFKSYFEGRGSKVCVNGILCKDICRLKRGVCQGSCLGPLLFLIYINDLPNAVQILKCLLFADDNQLLSSASNWLDISNKINAELKNVIRWYAVNKLPVHPDKTSLTFFTPNKIAERFKIPLDDNGDFLHDIVVDLNLDDNLPYDNTKVHKVHITNLNENDCLGGVKILGIFLDPELSFKYQADQVIAKQRSSIFALKQCKKFMDREHLLKLFNAFNRSHLNFAIPFLGTCNDNIINTINMLDRAAMRVIFDKKSYESISPFYKENNILTVHQLITAYKVKFMYKINNNMLGNSFSDQYSKVRDRITDRAVRNADDFDLPQRLEYQFLKRFPIYSFPSEYNKLPANIKNAKKLKTFVNRLKKYYLGHDIPIEDDE